MTKHDDFKLALDPDFKISDYNSAIERKDEEDKNEIADAIKRRLIQRYINPCEVKSNKNGFNIMANCCLLVETFESFCRGWGKSPSSELAFCSFFNRVPEFIEFTGNDMPKQFYKNIRCGILHQGETTGGWRISRAESKKWNKEEKIIDANYFRDELKRVVENYFDDLKNKDWSAFEWKMLEKKMKLIIYNCKK